MNKSDFFIFLLIFVHSPASTNILSLLCYYILRLLKQRKAKDLQTNENKGYILKSLKGKLEKNIKLKLRCIASCLLRRISPFDNETAGNLARRKNQVIFAVFCFIISFALGIAKLSLGITPFGLSVLCASGKKSSLYCFCGAALSCLFMGAEGIVPFITFFLIFLIRKSITDGLFNEKTALKVTICLFSSLFIGACFLVFQNLSAKSWISYITYVILSSGCTYLFSPHFSRSAHVSNSLYAMSLYSICISLVPFFNRISTSHIDFGLIFSSFITLWFSRERGPIYGCVCGFLTGFACSNPLVSAPLGLGGMICAYIFPKSSILSSLSFCLTSFFASVYLFGVSQAAKIFTFNIISCILFICLSSVLPKYPSNMKDSPKEVTRKRTKNSEFDKVSDSLSGLSAILYKFAEHIKAPTSTETGEIFATTLNEVCSSCSMNSMCFAKRECNLQNVKGTVVSTLHSGKIKEEVLSKLFLDKCIKVKEMCENLNAKYSELFFMTQKTNRTGTLAGMYNSMSHLIKSTSKQEMDKSIRDTQLEKTLSDALLKIGIDFSFIIAGGSRCKEIEIHGIRADKIPCTSKELCSYLSEKCKIKLSEPSFDISDSADMVMKFKRDEIITLEFSQCAKAKSASGVNGDTSVFFDTDEGYFYSIIADGMGSGKVAAATSRLSCVFLEKLLRAGTSKTVCLEMLNNLLLSKNDETFSGIDLLEIDKLTGCAYFIKAGAAPSFVLRNSRLYKICSETPPVGIIPAFSAESTRFSLEKGDIIIMLSDGVISSDSDGVWLSELIHLDRDNEPSFLASSLIEKARSINARLDDASACVIKVVG